MRTRVSHLINASDQMVRCTLVAQRVGETIHASQTAILRSKAALRFADTVQQRVEQLLRGGTRSNISADFRGAD